ncbi:SurA N-terminal domain-containing protein [Candidatus Ruminimicrobium bovinum]|uniref:peptidylprolyl isomerase n=1 Tax=Candidatus Ruminimicrobium bovinum TaxID=3242779 RepID=UPI0039B94287
MKKEKVVLSFLSCLVAVSLFVGCAKNDVAPVATVNNVPISGSDYEKNITRILDTLKIQNPQVLQEKNAEDIIGKRLLEDMIVREVSIQEAQKANITVTDEEVKELVNQAKAQFKKDENGNELTERQQEDAFYKALKEQGLTEKEYLDNVKKDVLINKYRRDLVSKNMKPATEEETKAFFNNISAIYNNDTKKIAELKKTPGLFEEADVVAQQLKVTLAPKAQIDTILVFVDGNISAQDKAARKELATKIRKEITNAAAFEDVAKKYTADPNDKIFASTIDVYKGMQPEEVSSKAISLNIDQVSDPIEVLRANAAPNLAQGYFIIKVRGKVAEQKFVYDTFKNDLTNYINNKRAEFVIAQSIANSVKSSDIKILKTYEMDKSTETVAASSVSASTESAAAAK